jgi:hypothetical protein
MLWKLHVFKQFMTGLENTDPDTLDSLHSSADAESFRRPSERLHSQYHIGEKSGS